MVGGPVESSPGWPAVSGTQGGVVALRTEGGLSCDVERFRSLIVTSSTWSFKCVKCIVVCYSTQFPAGKPEVYEHVGL